MKKINNTGITLITLVITIVVMVILAAVAIITLVGDDGIIARTNSAKETAEISQEKEYISLALVAIKTEGKEFEITKFEKEIENLADQDVTVEISSNFAKSNKEVIKSYKIAALEPTVQLAHITQYSGIYKVTFEETKRSYKVNISDGAIVQIDTSKEIQKIEPENVNDWEYTIESDNTITIHQYTGDETEITIPNYIGGIPVKKIAYKRIIIEEQSSLYYSASSEEYYNMGSAENSSNITKVTISDGIETIGDSAFDSCYGLKEIIIPNTVTAITKDAFRYCMRLTTIIIDNYEENLDLRTSELTSIQIENIIWKRANEKETYIHIVQPEKIEDWEYTIESNNTITINSYTGNDTDVTIPNYIGELPVKKLQGKTEEIIEDVSSSYYYTNTTFVTNSIWIKDNIDKIEKVTISDGIEIIGESAFANSSNLTTIFIPKSMYEVEINAFANCSNLNDITVDKTELNLKLKSEWDYSTNTSKTTGLTYEQENNIKWRRMGEELDQKYFTYELTTQYGQTIATITGIKDEYAHKIKKYGQYYKTGAIQISEGEYITDLVIPSTITEDGTVYNVRYIGQNAFKVEIPLDNTIGITSIKTGAHISSYAFANCTKLEIAYITHQYIGDSEAYYNCTKLHKTCIVSTSGVGGYSSTNCNPDTDMNWPYRTYNYFN